MHTSKLICVTIHLWIFLSTDNVLTLLQYDTGGGQSAELPGRAENLRNVTCSCCGSVLVGGYIIRFTWCHTDIALYLPIS